MKKLVLASLLTAAHVLAAGTCVYSFSGLENAGASDIAVPLLLEEGRNGFTYEGFATSDGSDLRVADSIGTVLPHEIDVWDPTGRSIVWVRVPELSGATGLTLSWGDVNAASASGHVWPSAEVVMHFTGDEPRDSSPAARAVSNCTEAQSSMDGPVGEARSFFGSPKSARLYNADVTLSKDTVSEFTISFWWKADVVASGANQYLFQLFSPGSTSREITAYIANTGKMLIYGQNWSGGLPSGSADVPDRGWHHYAFSYNGSVYSIYLDGRLVASNTRTTSIDASGRTWSMSFGSSRTPGAPASGSMDEFRFETVARSADYIRTSCELESKIYCDSVVPVTVAYPDVAVPAESPLADFPLFIPIRGVDTGMSDVLLSAIGVGNIEVVTAGSDVKHPCEIEYVYEDGMNAAGLWTRVPSFSRETVLNVRLSRSYYVPGAASPSAGVWDGGDYLLVNHIIPKGARTDSAHGIHFKPTNDKKTDWSLYSPVADGPTGPYSALLGGTSTVARASSVTVSGASLTNVYTISWWMKQEQFSSSTALYIIFLSMASDSKQRAIMVGGGKGSHTIHFYPDTPAGCGMQVPDEGWHHYAYVCDGAVVKKFIDGVQQAGTSIAVNMMMPTFSGKTIAIGNSAAGAQVGSAGFVGSIDEVRIEPVVRSAEWLAASYATQLAYRDGVGYGYAPEFAGGVEVEETGNSLRFSTRLSCRTTADCVFCSGATDGGDDPSAWDSAVSLGSKADGTVSATISAAAGAAVYGRFFASNGRGADSTRTVLARRDSEGICKAPLTVRYDGSETLTNFPLAVTFPSSSKLSGPASSLRILDASGQSLPVEVETWNPSGTSVVWVRIPRLSGNASLVATWRNGQNDDGIAWPRSHVWDGDYRRVYHFGDVLADSSAAGDDLVTVGSAVAGEGRVGGGVSFAASGAALAGGEPRAFNDFSGGFTFSLWARLDAGGSQRIAAFGASSYAFAVNYGTNGVDAVSLGLDGFYVTPKSGTEGGFNATPGVDALVEKSAIARPDADWHQYAWTSDGRWLSTYRDGSLVASVYFPLSLGSGIPETRSMTASFGGPAALRYSGELDEVRVAGKPRSAAWIAAAYANQTGQMVEVGPTERPGVLILFK